MAGLGVNGIDTPTSDVQPNNSIRFNATDESQPVIELGKSANAMAISAHPDNGGIIYIGDADVSVDNGFPLESGDAFVVGHDPFQDPIYAAADTAGDEIRVIAFS